VPPFAFASGTRKIIYTHYHRGCFAPVAAQGRRRTIEWTRRWASFLHPVRRPFSEKSTMRRGDDSGNVDDCSVCSFAVKPGALGARYSALGHDPLVWQKQA